MYLDAPKIAQNAPSILTAASKIRNNQKASEKCQRILSNFSPREQRVIYSDSLSRVAIYFAKEFL